MSNKIIIAKPGFNALTESDPNNLIFHSDYDTLKYFMSGTITVTTTGTTNTNSVDHDLLYTPFFIAYVDGFTPDYSMCPGYSADLSGYVHADCYADETSLYFRVHTDYFSGTRTFKYKIFRNRLNI